MLQKFLVMIPRSFCASTISNGPSITSQIPPHHQNGLNTISPTWGIQDNTHEQAGDETGTRQRDKPAHVNPSDHPPVDASPSAVAESNADGSAADALGGRDGELELGRHDNGDGGAELHRKAARGRVQRDLVAERAHDVVAVRPEADDDAGAAEG